jgi:hypothetical protein
VTAMLGSTPSMELPSAESGSDRGSRLAWTAAIAILSVASFAGMDALGRASRVPFQPPPGFAGRWGMVEDAAAAYRVWSAAGLRGRRLLVLSGQWSQPRKAGGRPSSHPGAGASDPAGVDANGAVFAAATSGIARRLDVVMPPRALHRQLVQRLGHKQLVREDRAFRHPFDALERRFSEPDAFTAAPEPVLVLVEASWFAEGGPEDVVTWLQARGVSYDLALLALHDGAADAGASAVARKVGEALGARLVEVGD